MIDTKGYTFESILLQSERLDRDIEMVNNVTDLEIYESLDKPFLTGRLAILDNDYLYEDLYKACENENIKYPETFKAKYN